LPADLALQDQQLGRPVSRYADIPKPVRSGIVIVNPQRGTPSNIIVL